MRIAWTAILPVLLTASWCPAGLAYRWEPASLDLVVGQTADAVLYLEETASAADSILIQQNGLSSVGVKVHRVGTAAATLLPMQVNLNSADFFDASNPVLGPWIVQSDAAFSCVLFARDAGVTGEALDNNRRRIRIGGFTFRGDIANSAANFQATDFNFSTPETITWVGLEVLDARVTPSSLPIFVAPPSRYCAADFDEDGGVTGADIGAFLAAFERGDARADVDDDGGVSFADVAAFFALFEAGGC